MADPTRLLDAQGASSTTVELLRALQPPQAAPAAVKAAMAGQLSTLVTQGGAKAAASVLWLKVAVVSIAVAGSGVAVWTMARPTKVAPLRPSVASASPAPAALEPASQPSTPPPPPASSAEVVAKAVTSPSSLPGPRDKLAEEEALLEQARAQLRQNPSRALGLLRRHQSQFPGGQLAAERMFLSVDCLSRLGMRAQAEREAKALAQRYPNSAYARRAPLLLASPSR